MSDRLVTNALKDALRLRFSGAEWACFFEVPMGTGIGGRDRTADAVAMNMYPSRGLSIHGVEVKASRSDWLRELRNPAKAEAIASYCDHWWIAAPKETIKREELPPTWGLLELTGTQLRQVVAAPRLSAKPLDRPFVASLLRCAAGRAACELRREVEKATAVERERAAAVVQADRQIRSDAAKYARLKASVDTFEKASGISIQDVWGGGTEEIGAVVRLVREMGIGKTHGAAQRLAREMRGFAERAEILLADFTFPSATE